MRGKWIALAALVVAVSVMPVAALAVPPSNDDVGAAVPVTAIPFQDSVEVGEATVQPGEPTETCAPFANTVWYALTLADTQDVRIDTAGSNYDTALAVWVGSSFDDVELVACNDDTFAGLQAAVTLTAEAGVTYLVQVGAFFSAPPEALLEISFGEPAKSTGKPLIFKDQFRGQIADAFLEEFDEDSFSFSGVRVVDGFVKSKGSPPLQITQLVVDSFEEVFDEETGTFTFTSWFGFADLEPGEFQLGKRLQTASVSAAVTLFGETCTSADGFFECTFLGEAEATVDVSWTGQGPVFSIRDRSSDSAEGFRTRFRGSSKSREATVAGGVSGEVGFDLTGAQGRLSNEASGSWFWVRGGGDGFFGLGGAEGGTLTAGTPAVMFDRFRGSFAQAFDEEFDEETGSFAFRDVTLMDGRAKSKGDKWFSFAELFVSSFEEQFDDVAGTFTFTEWFGFAPLAGSDYSISRSLEGATVTAEVVLTGQTCTETFENGFFDCTFLGETTALVDVEWAASGSLQTSRFSFDERIENSRFRFSGRFANRPALANGTVSGDLAGWLYEDADGFLSREASGSWFKMR